MARRPFLDSTIQVHFTADDDFGGRTFEEATRAFQRLAANYPPNRTHPQGEAMDRRDIIKAELARLQAELVQLETLPERDPFPNGTVLKFSKAFIPGATLYTFVALKTSNRWYLSGRQRGDSIAKTWTQLREFLSEGVNLANVQRSSTWRSAFSTEPF